MANGGMVWMPIYHGNYLSKTIHLTMEQHGIYLMTLLLYWQAEGPLTENTVDNMCQRGKAEWMETKEILAEFFTIKKGMWKNKRAEIEIAKAKELNKQLRARTKAATKARWPGKNT